MYGREDGSKEQMKEAVQLVRGRGPPPGNLTAFKDVTGVKRHFVRVRSFARTHAQTSLTVFGQDA
jgi:hypothetical protein